MTNLSPEYVEHFKKGPFPNTLDPFAEEGRYFHAIHGGMIDVLLDSIQDRLIAMGYRAEREISLQIFAQRQPDLYVESTSKRPLVDIDYDAIAAALDVTAGTAFIDEELELEALHIKEMDTGNLVTVIEIISPRNKTHIDEMLYYQKQRQHVFIANGVNVVEIDATRSVRRLVNHPLADDYPYHIVVFMPKKLPRFIENEFEAGLTSFALPLAGEAIRVEPQQAYDRAYQRGAIAGLILQEEQYTRDSLPFPSTLTEAQIESAIEAVEVWQAELERLV